jgi:hypothetical protein
MKTQRTGAAAILAMALGVGSLAQAGEADRPSEAATNTDVPGQPPSNHSESYTDPLAGAIAGAKARVRFRGRRRQRRRHRQASRQECRVGRF